MSMGSMVRSDIADKTAGYGNTRTGVAVTTEYLADNEVCEGIMIGPKWNRRPLPPQNGEPPSMLFILDGVLKMKDPERGAKLDELRAAWLKPHTHGTTSWYIASNRFNAMITELGSGRGFAKLVGGCRKKAA
jgi:hypothetical protein